VNISRGTGRGGGGGRHRVGRVLSFSPVVGIGIPPTPHPQFPGVGAHSLAKEGVGESQFRRGDIHCGTMYFVGYGVQYRKTCVSGNFHYAIFRGICKLHLIVWESENLCLYAFRLPTISFNSSFHFTAWYIFSNCCHPLAFVMDLIFSYFFFRRQGPTVATERK
jgi:hypothetical protein